MARDHIIATLMVQLRHNFPSDYSLDGADQHRGLLAGCDLVAALDLRDAARDD